jgi:hypothetical protein
LRKLFILAALLLLIGVFVSAQEFGDIRGTVLDAEDNPLPGVTVTLTGAKIGTMTAITSERGTFRFVSLPVANDYALKLELPGFKTIIREKLVVSYGRDVFLEFDMEMTTLEEQITVVGQTPVIDAKRTQVGVNVTEEMIMSLPTARNPWVIMQMLPGMLIDREDIGGNEGGQQSSYYGHGSPDGDSTWNLDGANITDNSALGAAPAYMNIAMYEEMQLNYGNNDVKAQTGGVQLNLVTKRGGNVYSGTFFLDVERNAWQADNVPDDLKDIGYTAAGINRVYLYGANFGGPLIKDRAWFYGSWGIQDIDSLTLAGTSDKTWLASGYGKLDFQITPSTRLNGFVSYDNKNKWGRTNWGATQQGPETLWNQTGPGYIWKGQFEQMFGNLYFDAKYIFTNGGFNLQPVQGPRTKDGSGNYLVRQYYPSFYAYGNIDDYGTDRDQHYIAATGNLFLEDVLGGDHEWKFGFDYVVATTTTFDYYEGNLSLAYSGPDSTMPNGEWWEAWLVRDYLINYWFNRYSFYVQDTFSVGRLAINFGIRYDQEASKVKDANIPASPWLPYYMPAVSVDELDPGVAWKVWSPRIALSYDIFGTGKDVIKLSAALYGSQSGNGLADFINPIGWTEIDMLWQDANEDGRVTSDELWGYDWDTGELKDPNDPDYWLYSTATVNPSDPTSIVPNNKYDPDYNSPKLYEFSVSYEKELFTDFAARIEGFYKKSTNGTWTWGMFPDGTFDSQANYYYADTETEYTGYDYYGRTSRPPYSYRTNYPNRYDTYMAGQLVVTKRLSNKWMLDASFTLSDWKRHYEGDYFDPMNIEYYDGGVVAPGSGGSGLTGIYVNSRWQFKLSGLYQLPYGINVSGVFMSREGYVKLTDVRVYRPGIGYSNLYGSPDGGGKFGDERLPAFWVLNFRLEKVFMISDAASVTVSADAFNITNSAHALKQETRMSASNFGQDLRILNPRLFRFGIRFNF